jgi:hypothetical protein
MIRRITSILNESVTAIPVGERVPFAEVIDGVPTVHAGEWSVRARDQRQRGRRELLARKWCSASATNGQAIGLW